MKKIRAFAFLCSFATIATAQTQIQTSEPDLHQLAVEAHTYLYPLVLLDTVRRTVTNVETADAAAGLTPANTFLHQRCLTDHVGQAAPYPNLDALHSSAWIDVSREPVILQWPEIPSRLHHLSLIDLWGETFASLGSRTLGQQPGKIALTPPGWNGKLPKDIERLESPSPYVRITGLLLVRDPEDCPAVNSLQDDFRMTPLADWLKEGKGPKGKKFKPDPRVDMTTSPLNQVKALPPALFFKTAVDLLRLQKPNPTDGTMLLHLRKLGLETNKRFEFEKLAIPVQTALNEAAGKSLQRVQWRLSTPVRWGNGWTLESDIFATYGNHYLHRAAAVEKHLGSAPAEDILTASLRTDAEGQTLNGELNYVLRFRKDELPPAAYWTITLYDPAGQIPPQKVKPQRINANAPFKADNQGNVELYFQAYTPGDMLENNWFPTPKAPFVLVMRLYGAQATILEKQWTPPALETVKNRM